MFKFKMNQVVKDKVTGYQGVILARIEYATGCQHYGVCQQVVSKEGKIPEWEYIDESRLVLVGKIKELVQDDSPGETPPQCNES